MVRATYIFVFLFYLQTGCFGNPVTDPEPAFSTHRIYNYHGEINATNSADNETISRWAVSGKLSVYNEKFRMVFQLKDVKTSVYNGPRSELNNVQEKEIPEEAKVLLQPFTVVSENDIISIYFLPNEPLWSQNFKRGLASNMDLEVDIVVLQDAEKNSGASVQQTTLYGRCDVHYKASFDTAVVYERSFRHSSCEKSPKKHQVYAFTAGNLEDYESKTVTTTTMLERNDTYMQQHMVTVSHIQAQMLPVTPHSQYIDQLTKLDLLDFEETEASIPIDISKMTDKRELIYEVGDEPTSGRHTFDTSTSGLTKQFLDNYDKFDNYFQYSPLQHVDLNNQDSIENMFLALKKLDVDGLKHLQEAIAERKDEDLMNMYFALLPYIGTEASVKSLIPHLLQFEFRENEMRYQRIMAVFPIFLENYTDELLDELEPLMNINQFNRYSTRNAGVLSFASVIAQAGRHGALTKTKNVKYTKLFLQKFMDSNTYEQRMVHLLGLINMDETFDLHLMNHIITNTTESKHIRTLALVGFKHLLVKYSDVTELFGMYWPIVQNNKEPFDVRVRALDLLLSVNLSQELFDIIIKKYSSHFNDPEDTQLANYVLTSLHSLQNTTYFQDHIGSKASEALKDIKIPPMETFSTGNYRLTHSDKDIGAYVQTRLISDPFNNMVNSVEVNYKSYGFSYQLNGYSLYLNLGGLFDSFYINKYIMKLVKEGIFEAPMVPELLALLQENHMELMSILDQKEYHIDIVVFKDNTAVYAAHFSRIDKFRLMQIAADLVQLMEITLSVQFPLVNYIQMPSDLGTPLQFSNFVEDITYLNITPYKRIKYRTTWNCQSWIEVYNPLVDTNIATYKYTGIDKAIDIEFSMKNSLSWLNKKDSIMMYTDNIIGTSVEDENILKQYCEKCEAYINIDLPCNIDDGSFKFEKLGFKLNVSREGTSSDSCFSTLPDTAMAYFSNEDYKSNIDAFPKAGPIVYLVHAFYRNILFDSDFSKTSYHSIPFLDEDTETELYMDVDTNVKPGNLDPFEKKVVNFIMKGESKIVNQTEIASFYQVNYTVASEPQYIDDANEKHFAYFATLNIRNNATALNDRFKISAKRELLLPNIKSDRYSLEPVAPAAGKFVWTICRELDGDDDTCTTSAKVFTFIDTFTATKKDEKLKVKQNKDDYDECMKDSKDLKFIAPTSACKRISARLADYDHYENNFKAEKYPKEEGGKIETIEKKEPVFAFSRKENDYLELKVAKEIEIESSGEEDVFHTKIYEPHTINPIAMAYSDSNSALPMIATSKCTITPSTIEQFSGKYTPNEKKEWFAFSECFNETRRALTGHTIGKHNVELTYRTNDTVITATVKDEKVYVEINGKEFPHYANTKKLYPYNCIRIIQNNVYITLETDGKFDFDHQYAKVYFLDDNVVMILDQYVNIYYNTEYMQVTVNALYSTLLCGACTQVL